MLSSKSSEKLRAFGRGFKETLFSIKRALPRYILIKFFAKRNSCLPSDDIITVGAIGAVFEVGSHRIFDIWV